MADAVETVRLPSRHRTVRHKEVQTEASFVPECIDLKYKYDPMASELFTSLTKLRTMIELCMQELGRTVYDAAAFKDILFRIEDELPSHFPMTDMLLMSSKLFRKTAELGRLLRCFFEITFGDDHADEHFHFAEIRILQRELEEVKRRLRASEEEKANLQSMLNNFGQMALDHGKAVEMLENQNAALQMQTTALEDQMALLFHQLNSDLEVNCKEAYDKVTMETELQERMNPARTTFRQTIDSISQQIRASRALIADVRETLLSCGQGSRTNDAYLAVEPSVRFKLKTLDSDFQKLVGRFNSVKDTVVETAQEHMNALQERKKILYLSFQHVRLYDLQNAKLRQAKALLNEIRSHTGDLLRKTQATFPSGAITSVDRVGRITSQRWQGGYTLAALRLGKKTATTAGGDGGVASQHALSEATMMAAQSELAALGGNSSSPGLGLTPPGEDTLSAQPAPSRGATMTGNNTANSSNNIASAPLTVDAGETTSNALSLSPFSHAVSASSPQDASLLAVSMRSNSIPATSNPNVASNKRFVLPEGGLQPPTTIVEEDLTPHAEPFATVHALSDVVRAIDTGVAQLNEALTLEDEMAAFLKILTLTVSSTARLDARQDTMRVGVATERYESNYGEALLPTGGGGLGGRPQRRGDDVEDEDEAQAADSVAAAAGETHGGAATGKAARPGSSARQSKSEQIKSETMLVRQAQQIQRQQEQLLRLQEDFSNKIGFLRQVYEARIADLEVKESAVRRTFSASGAEGGGGGILTPPRSLSAERVGSASRRRQTFAPMLATSAAATGGAKGGDGSDYTLVRDGNSVGGEDEEQQRLQQRSDRDELLATRTKWRRSRQAVQSQRQLREATVSEIASLDRKTQERREKKSLATMKRNSTTTNN